MSDTDTFFEHCAALKEVIEKTYNEGTSLEEAERLAARFLAAQMSVADELRVTDLDARMRKTGVKAVKAGVYLKEATKGDKKPSDVMLEALVNSNDIVQKEQDSYDESESNRDSLQNYFNIFKEAHIYYRGIAKGRFE